MKKRWLVFLVFCAVLGTISLWTQERGSIRGIVKSADGTILENATAKIVGSRLPLGREFVTGKDGSFLFQALPPGTYKLTVTHAQMIDFEMDVIVGLDKQTPVSVRMTPVGKIEEEVTVTAASPIVDLKSTEISSNWQKTLIEKLPLGRSYSSLFQLAPGVADNRDFAPNAGGNKQDNVYLYDGSNITNPLFGYLGANFSELDIEEVNIKRGGISAEFGRATGMVTNAITKSGSNRIAGTVRLDYAPAAFTGKFRDPNIITKYSRFNPALSLGGPVIRDKLWWYMSGNFPRSKTTGRVNTLGPVPNAKDTANEVFVKLSSNPLPPHQFAVSFRDSHYTSTNAGIGVNDAPSVAIDGKGHDRIIYGSWVWSITQSTLLEVKYDRVDEKYKSVPIRDLGYQPKFNPAALNTMGYFRTAAGYIYPPATLSGKYVGAASEYNTQNFFRNEVKFVFSKYLDFRNHSHIIKAGFGYDDGGEYLERLANGWGSIITTTYNKKFAFRARYYSRQAPQDSRGRTYSIFLQDMATIGERLTFTLGVLLNRDEFSSKTATEKKTFLKFDFGKEVQPRIGFTYMLDAKAGDKLYANWGRYNNMDNRSIARAWAPIRIYRNDAYFDAAGNLLADTPQASETGKLILPDLKSTYTDEFVMGYARPLGKQWSVEVWGQYRTMKHMLEDYAVYKRDTSPSNFVGGNLDGQLVSYASLPAALQAKLPVFADFTAGKGRRVYKAFTLEVKRLFSERWSLTATYTLSRMEGNWDLDYASGTALFYASSYLEDAPGLFVSDPNRDGILMGDRTHVLKFFGTWEFYKRTTLGVYWRLQSGAPWEPRGQDYYGNYYRYLAKAGSYRLGTWGNVDAQLSHVIPVGRFNAIVEVRAMNAIGTQTVMSRDLRTDQPTYLNATSYASPRRFVLTFYLNF